MSRIMSIIKYGGLITFLVIIGLIGEKYHPLKEEALLRIASTAIQTFAALLALIGMFAVYRMQTIQNEISQLELLKNERFFQKESIFDELEGLKKLKRFMRRFKLKGTQSQIEEIDKAIVEELERAREIALINLLLKT